MQTSINWIALLTLVAITGCRTNGPPVASTKGEDVASQTVATLMSLKQATVSEDQIQAARRLRELRGKPSEANKKRPNPFYMLLDSSNRPLKWTNVDYQKTKAILVMDTYNTPETFELFRIPVLSIETLRLLAMQDPL